ncbi:MAG: SCO family protein [Novosphingobium sp.]
MNRSAMSRLKTLFAAGLLTLALSACGPSEEPPLARARIGGEFDLVNKDGRYMHWRNFDGRYRIVYFGYTFCPDVCPTDVGNLMRGYGLFAKDHPRLADQVQPIFISVDPERDTPARVGEFAAAFSPRLIGLTGSEREVAQAARAFAVYYAKGEMTPGGYLVNHTRIAYLMDRDGKPLATLPSDLGAEAVAAELEKWVH